MHVHGLCVQTSEVKGDFAECCFANLCRLRRTCLPSLGAPGGPLGIPHKGGAVRIASVCTFSTPDSQGFRVSRHHSAPTLGSLVSLSPKLWILNFSLAEPGRSRFGFASRGFGSHRSGSQIKGVGSPSLPAVCEKKCDKVMTPGKAASRFRKQGLQSPGLYAGAPPGSTDSLTSTSWKLPGISATGLEGAELRVCPFCVSRNLARPPKWDSGFAEPEIMDFDHFSDFAEPRGHTFFWCRAEGFAVLNSRIRVPSTTAPSKPHSNYLLASPMFYNTQGKVHENN